MPRIVLIDDDESLLDVLALAFEEAGHDVVRAHDGAAGLRAIRSGADVVISDINMPRTDGFTLVRTLRAEGNATPIILLTSRDNEIDEALGLEMGADDYVAKPFSTRVLMARVSALLRREAARARPRAGVVRIGALELDADCLEARYLGKSVAVTVTEFRILEALTQRPGVVWQRARLLEEVRGDDSVVAERIIDTYVRRLRRKLEAIDPTFADLETVIGAGYRWRAP
jgi:DNA-binding response OmpR family regulator